MLQNVVVQQGEMEGEEDVLAKQEAEEEEGGRGRGEQSHVAHEELNSTQSAPGEY